MRLLLFILFFVALGLLWKATPLSEYATPEHIAPLLEDLHDSDWAIPGALLVYTFGTLLFFPHVVLSIAMVLAFPPLEAIGVIIFGSLMSGSIGYFIGRELGMKSLRFLTGGIAEKISYYATHGGLLGLTVLRMVPTGPFTAVNLVLGMSRAPFGTFLAATVLGLLPGSFVGAMIGSSLMNGWSHTHRESILYISFCLAGWAAILAGAHYASRAWERRHPRTA